MEILATIAMWFNNIVISISDKVTVTAYSTVICCQQEIAACQLEVNESGNIVFASLNSWNSLNLEMHRSQIKNVF